MIAARGGMGQTAAPKAPKAMPAPAKAMPKGGKMLPPSNGC
jgi:hypothetical protein